MGRKGLHRGVQLPEHPRVDFLLRIVGRIEGVGLAHLRIGNRAVGVGHALHDAHPADIAHGQQHLVVGHRPQLEVERIELRNGVVERDVDPRLRGVIGGIAPAPARSGVGVGAVTAPRAAHQAVDVLADALGFGHQQVLHPLECRRGNIVVVLHLRVVGLVGVLVELLVVGRAGGRSRQQQRRQEAQRRFYGFHRFVG